MSHAPSLRTYHRRCTLAPAVRLLLVGAVATIAVPGRAAHSRSIQAAGVHASFDAKAGQLIVLFTGSGFRPFTVTARPQFTARLGWRVSIAGRQLHVKPRGQAFGRTWTAVVTPGTCRLEGGAWQGEIWSADELWAARIVEQNGKPATHATDDIFETACGRASNRRMNIVYSPRSFWGVYFGAPAGATPDLRPLPRGYAWQSAEPVRLKATDLWPALAWRRQGGYTFGREKPNHEYIAPRRWFQEHRPFPWPRLSPVQLPYLSMSDPRDWDRTKEQLDFLARELRDYGFFCYGEWPLTQYYPEYDPKLQPAFLAGNKRTCDYAHRLGLKVLRWVTDPDIQPDKYPKLHAEFLARGWFSPGGKRARRREWLLDYSNPEVQAWITKQYSRLAATGPDFYWIDNNHPTQPRYDPFLFAPDAFRFFYRSIRRGLLSTGRHDILVRSGASAWANYTGIGLLDVYAPGPDIQNDWREQQVSAATNLTRLDYLCHSNFWWRGLDDFFPAGPQTVDQTRAMACLLALTGIGFTTTDIGLPKIPHDRLELLRQLVPLALIRPLDLYRFRNSPAPRVWVLNVRKGEFQWQVLAVFNWGLRTEQRHFISFADLGLDPDGEYLLFDFFSQKPVGVITGGVGCRVAPGSARAIAIHPLRQTPFLVSTDRHVTQGASEIGELRWNSRRSELSGVFVAGVAGRTYHLTLYAPPGWQCAGGSVDGKPVAVDSDSPPLLTAPLPCHGPTVRWTVRFRRQATPTTPPAKATSVALPEVASPAALALFHGNVAVIDFRRSSVRGAFLTHIDQLVRRLTETPLSIILRAPIHSSPPLRLLQDRLSLPWGVVRSLDGSAGRLLVALSDSDPEGELLFQSSVISFALADATAAVRRMGRGRVVVVSPFADDKWVAQLARKLKADADGWQTQQRAALTRFDADSQSTASEWTASLTQHQVRAQIHLSPSLRRAALSFHVDRRLPSLTGAWGVPQLELTLNGHPLPHLLNPCRPHSPPRNFDRVYFSIPDGVARFDSPNALTIRFKGAPRDANRLRREFQRALELRIETPGEVGRWELVPLPPCVVLPPARLLALLGAAGTGDIVPARVPGVGYTVTGATPYAGWPTGQGEPNHCVFADEAFTVVVTVPPGSAGTVSVYAYDADAYRKERLSFEGGPPKLVEHFDAGRWLDFPFRSTQSADGRLALRVEKVVGANCVLSKLKVTLGG